MKRFRLLSLTDPHSPLLLSLPLLLVLSQSRASCSEPITLRQGLAVGGGGRAGRSPVHTDAIEAEIISGKWQRPAEGGYINLADGTSPQWHSIEADTNGWFADESWPGGYAFVPMTVEAK